ncbi:MAG: amidohydrolase [Chloroflexi bacterium RBG_16_51_16]|nr:MAG: amidohydrolase [Chloroflexi bacterium RBG_16_51_16]
MTQNADILFTNAIVLTMDTSLAQYEPGAVAVQGDSILDAGYEDDLKKEFKAKEIIDCGGKALLPGLINAHTHVPMTLLRGLADDLRLDVWLMGFMLPVEREFVSPEYVRLGTLLACAEQIRSGITTFNDMYYYEHEVAKATAEAGMRAVCGQTVMKYTAPDAPAYEDSLAMAREFIKEWKDHPLIVPAIAPHAPYSCTPEILRNCAELAVEFDVPLHIHIAETALEVENMRNENGMPVVPYVKKQGLLDAKVIAAHCVHIDQGEMRTLLHAGAGVAHNPSSNLKLASGFAPVQKMIDNGLNVGIGTDGPASNNDLDMFEEIRLASLIAKASTGDPTVLPAATALLLGTRLGAQALHLGHLTGSLEKGKRADLILVDLSPAHNTPRFRRDVNNAYAQLVYAAKSTDVSDVMVNGRWLMRDHQLLTVNERELVNQARVIAAKIDIFLIEREQSVLSKLIALGGSMEEESFEVQVKVKVKDPERLIQLINQPGIRINAFKHYRQYDDYFFFDNPSQGRLRFREDDLVNTKGEVANVRSRLTLIGQKREERLGQDVLLSRSRFLAPAAHTLRFYREYFTPQIEVSIKKDRQRWHIQYKNTEFFVNLDHIEEPEMGYFLEIKSRTWSRNDAERKADLLGELLTLLGENEAESVLQDYIEIIREQG